MNIPKNNQSMIFWIEIVEKESKPLKLLLNYYFLNYYYF